MKAGALLKSDFSAQDMADFILTRCEAGTIRAETFATEVSDDDFGTHYTALAVADNRLDMEPLQVLIGIGKRAEAMSQ